MKIANHKDALKRHGFAMTGQKTELLRRLTLKGTEVCMHKIKDSARAAIATATALHVTLEAAANAVKWILIQQPDAATAATVAHLVTTSTVGSATATQMFAQSSHRQMQWEEIRLTMVILCNQVHTHQYNVPDEHLAYLMVEPCTHTPLRWVPRWGSH